MSEKRAHFERYKDTRGDWRWRLRAANGRIVADSAEGYASKRNAGRAIQALLDAVESARTGELVVQEVAG